MPLVPACSGEPGSFWFCPNCDRHVVSSAVDEHERHVFCGFICRLVKPEKAKPPQLALAVKTRENVINNYRFQVLMAQADAKRELIKRLVFVLRMPMVRLEYVLTMIAMKQRENDEDWIFGEVP